MKQKGIARGLKSAMFAFACILLVVVAQPQKTMAGTLSGVNNLKQKESYWDGFKVAWDKDINAAYYEVQYSTDKKNWSEGSFTSGNDWYTSYLNYGKSYYVRVRSWSETGYDQMRWNEEITEQPSAWCSAIEVVSNPEIIPDSMKQTAGTNNSISLSWEKTDGAKKYQVVYNSGSSDFVAGETTKTSYTIKGLEPDKYYYVKVIPIRTSESSFEAKGDDRGHYCYTTPGKVRNIQYTKWDTTENTVYLEWENRENYRTGYEIFVSNLSGKKVKNYKVTSNYTDFSVKSIKNSGCIVKIRSYYDVDGTTIYGKWSDLKVIVAQPRLSITRKSETSLSLKWAKISGATSYTIYRSTSSYTGFKKIKTTKATSLTNSGLKKNTTYYYYVVANGVKVKGKSLSSTKADAREIAYLGWWDTMEYTY